MMRYTPLYFLLFSFSFCAEPVTFDEFTYEGRDPIFAEPVPEGHFQNPILAGFYPDPSITRAGDAFYLVNSSFSFYPGIPIFRSRDLVNWESLGYVLDRPSQLDVGARPASRAIFAPTIEYHEGVFYVITTDVDGIGNFYVTTEDPEGPWSDPIHLPFIDGIDPSFFFHPDGRVFIAHNGPPPDNVSLYEGHRAVWLWEYDMENNQPVGPGKIIINGGVDLSEEPVWIEAPHIYLKDGAYYLTCAEGGTSVNHSQVIFRAESMESEWIPWENNPILTQRDLDPDRDNPIVAAGHADLVQLPNGDWWTVFLSVRPYDGEPYTTGRETYLLPVDWPEGGWPMILEQGEAIPWRPRKPDLPEGKPGTLPLTGNFVWRDDFDSAPLSQAWNFLRTPKGNVATLDTAGSRLLLHPLTTGLSDLEQPAWLARRVQHNRYTVKTRMAAPADHVSAGLAAFIREDHHFFFGIRKTAAGYIAFVEKTAGDSRSVAAELPLFGLDPTGMITLEIQADEDEISFFLRSSDGSLTPVVEGEDATILTTTRAWGFIGTMVGPHARLDLQD